MKIARNPRTEKFLLILLAVILILGLLLLAVHFFGDLPASDPSEAGSVSEDLTYYQGSWYAMRKDLETLLLIGLDKTSDEVIADSYNNDRQADVLSLLVLDRTNGVCHVLPLNRDTMTEICSLGLAGEINHRYQGQLALAHTHGRGRQDSALNVCRAVSTLLYGVKIDHYVTMTMDGIAVLNDAVGGVKVTVEDDFSAVTDRLPMGQEVRLTGDLAEIFIRSRRGMQEPTNTARMKRQRAYMEGLLAQLQEKSRADSNFAASTLLELSDYILTDCTATKLEKLYRAIAECEIDMMPAPAGEAVVGKEFWEFYVDKDKLQQTVIDLFFEIREAEDSE